MTAVTILTVMNVTASESRSLLGHDRKAGIIALDDNAVSQ
jgi:hypothetical protein